MAAAMLTTWNTPMPPNGGLLPLFSVHTSCRCLWAYLFTSDFSCCFCNLTSQRMRQMRNGRSNKRQMTSVCSLLFAGTVCVCVRLRAEVFEQNKSLKTSGSISVLAAGLLSYTMMCRLLWTRTYCNRQFTYRFAILNDVRIQHQSEDCRWRRRRQWKAMKNEQTRTRDSIYYNIFKYLK